MLVIHVPDMSFLPSRKQQFKAKSKVLHTCSLAEHFLVTVLLSPAKPSGTSLGGWCVVDHVLNVNTSPGFKTKGLPPAVWRGGESEALDRLGKHLDKKVTDSGMGCNTYSLMLSFHTAQIRPLERWTQLPGSQIMQLQPQVLLKMMSQARLTHLWPVLHVCIKHSV